MRPERLQSAASGAGIALRVEVKIDACDGNEFRHYKSGYNTQGCLCGAALSCGCADTSQYPLVQSGVELLRRTVADRFQHEAAVEKGSLQGKSIVQGLPERRALFGP